MPKQRLDLLLVERGLAESRALAQRLVMAGQVRVDGQVALKPSTGVAPDALLEVDQGPPFVSRGGEKLSAGLQSFHLEVSEVVCADVGASTGGFTDCLLQHGAARVYAIDVGKGLLAWKLRQDPRVVVMEGVNARFVERLPEPVQLVTIDAAFISLKVLFPIIKDWFAIPSLPEVGEGAGAISGNSLIPLIKPQFEAGRSEVARGKGVIRDPEVHRQVLLDVLEAARQERYTVRGLIRSPLFGPKGNAEFLAWLTFPEDKSIPASGMDLAALVDKTLTSKNP